MLTYDEALANVLEKVQPLGTEILPLDALLGHVLAEPVRAPHDMPLFDNSAVDGYGVIYADVAGASSEKPVALRYSGTVQAGDFSENALQKGETVKILTGAPVPPGVEAVVMQEFTHQMNGQLQIPKSIQHGDNIRFRGEEFKQGDVVLAENQTITPPVVGLLASLGLTSAVTYRKPKVAVVVTGNELVPPGQPLAPGQIYESNSYSLIAALKSLGCEPVTVRCVADSLAETTAILGEALAQADVLITSGGVSVGEFDWVKEAAQALDVQTRFWKVAIKPGKPVFFGTKGEKLIFGLPGNPVAVMLTFQLFVKPALLKMQGNASDSSCMLKARLLKDLRKRPERLDFVRGKLGRDDQGLTALPVSGQGSHMLGGLAQADCLLPFALEASELPAGTWVDVMPLNWGPF